jgi:pimeloyl-ACP methyl ester carboxylesterase
VSLPFVRLANGNFDCVLSKADTGGKTDIFFGTMKMDMSVKETIKETIIIVHGTWAGLEAGKNRWYQAAEGIDAAQSFPAKLDAALKERGSPARCWAHCIKSDQIFHWSPGANDWVTRTRAAAALADYVANIQNKGWECHLIGHSHGGNVVLEAATSNEPLGKIVTLGTPFLDTISPIRNSAQRRRRLISAICMIGGFLLLLIFQFFWFDMDWKNVARFYAAIGGIIFGLALIERFFRRRTRNEVKEVSAFLSKAPPFHTPLLAMGSPMDEAWQVLHHLGAIPNPLAIRSGPLRYLFSSL